MSLYSSLTQVLAPFAAKINGLLTGWDGTRYSTPGEAVRQQIADLHVLIGDEPGRAISASAISYGDSDVGTELTNVNGRLTEQEEIVERLNEGGLDIKDDVIEAQITDWLNDHPEATTTVVDGSISEAKLASALKPKIMNTYVIPEMYGAIGDGTTDDTSAVQSAVNSGHPVLLLAKTYKITQITLNPYNVLYGTNKDKSVLLGNTSDYTVIIPKSANDCELKNFTTSGVEVGKQGTATVQDLNTRITDVRCADGMGFYISHRGGSYTRLRAGNTEYGVRIVGTDNTFTDCVTAMTKNHGFAVSGPNNSLVNCKAFMAGRDKDTQGKGFFVTGAFCRMVGCEAQQNYFEGFWFQNSHGSIISGCISDGNFWANYSEKYNSILGEISTAQSVFHSCDSAICDITCINGSQFGESLGETKYSLLLTTSMLTSGSIIFATSYNRNSVTGAFCNKEVGEFTDNTNLILNNYREQYYKNNAVDAYEPSYNESLVQDLNGKIVRQHNTVSVSVKFTAKDGYSYQTVYIYNKQANTPLFAGIPLTISPNANGENVVVSGTNGNLVFQNLQANTEYKVNGSYICA